MTRRAVVVGAGIAGVAATHSLTNIGAFDEVVLIDPRPPLTLTSDKSTECYRNWWPNAPMVGLMNRSIDLLEGYAGESDNRFGLNRRGYLFVTADSSRLEDWGQEATRISGLGAGPVRVHPGPVPYKPPAVDGYQDQPQGVDLFVDGATLRRHFPYLTGSAVGALHVRRAGWFSAQQLGAWMLESARERGLTLIKDEVVGIGVENGAVVNVDLRGGETLSCHVVVNAAGPMAADIAALVSVDLPLASEVHLKVAYRDHRGVVPREAPMIIWSDPQRLPWSPAERAALAEEGRDDLLGELPVFCHGRPEGGKGSNYFLALWEYHDLVQKPTWPLPGDDLYPEVVIRGLSTMVPGFARYLDGLPPADVDGGYYTKTPENRPLVGPAGPAGFFLCCGLSGFGVMVAAGVADLLTSHLTGSTLPDYSDAFLLSRYDIPGYMATIGTGVDSGQL